MIKVIVPLKLLEYLIKNKLDFKVTTQNMKYEHIEIEFENNHVSVNRFGSAYCDYGYNRAKNI